MNAKSVPQVKREILVSNPFSFAIQHSLVCGVQRTSQQHLLHVRIHTENLKTTRTVTLCPNQLHAQHLCVVLDRALQIADSERYLCMCTYV